MLHTDNSLIEVGEYNNNESLEDRYVRIHPSRESNY